jgi:hypothetical protein
MEKYIAGKRSMECKQITLLFTQSKQTLTGREPEKRIKHRERCTLASSCNNVPPVTNRNKIKHRNKYKIGKSPTPLGKITIVL